MEFADNNKNLILNYLNSIFCLNNISHANLIISPDSFYNQFVAKTFSEIILCKNKNLCGICKPCLMNKSESNPDLVKYPRQTIFNTLDVTDIINNSLESPLYSEFKIVIINNIDQATIQAQNKLLKILEEPPKHIIFIITANNENKILQTIISRTRKIYLKPLKKDMMQLFLDKNYNDSLNKISYVKDDLENAITLSEGWPGKALLYLTEEDLSDSINLAKTIANSFSSSKDISSFAFAIINKKEKFNLFLKLLQSEFEKLLHKCSPNSRIGICNIIELINNCSHLYDSNININILIDNLLMGILENKYNYNLK